MEETGGELRVSLGFKNLDETAGRNLCLSSGLYCVLTIEDTGHGMDSRTAQRIFDPYFTTKEIGKGTGMGLSVVHGIVLNHEGAISVESKENEGTKFQIYLPGEFEEEKTKTVENKKSERLLSEKWRILFVDDEEVLCELAEEALSNAGYLIQTVSSSREALELFQQTPDAFDVVITDLTMPEITGDILISRIKEIRKDIKVILCTGYNYNLSDTMREKINVDMYLVKPLSISDIDEAVMDVLRQGR
jgi:CheY-like chemotaxis protein